MMDQPYSPFADWLSPAHAWLAALGDAGSVWGSAEGASLTALGDEAYSPFADWLSKFYLASEPIQALWIVALSATILGVTWIVMRGLREIVRTLRHPRERAEFSDGYGPNPDGSWIVSRHGSPRDRAEERPGPDRARRSRGQGPARCDAPTAATRADRIGRRRSLAGLVDVQR